MFPPNTNTHTNATAGTASASASTSAGANIRQRKPAPSTTSSTATTAERYIEGLVTQVPGPVRPYVTKLVPLMCLSANFLERSTPALMRFLSQLGVWWKSLEPYHPELLLPSVAGLVLCFFGGSFFTLIAAVEAYRLVGYERSARSLQTLYDDFSLFWRASEEDNSKDEDGNGIADVHEISSEELLRRKSLLFLKTVDPKRATEAVSIINSGLLAVIATLKLQFAKNITLGSAIAANLERISDRYALPAVEASMAPDYKRWAQPLLSYGIHAMAISLAWFMQRVLSAFHSAIRGGLMFSRNILVYLDKMNILHVKHEDTMIDEALGYGIALLGFLFQISTGFRLFFPLNLLFLPFTILEWFFMWMVGR